MRFDPEKSAKLQSKMIFVRRGKILSGEKDYPTDPAIRHEIILSGSESDNSLAFDPEIEVVNNALIVTGEVSMHGAPKTSWTKLVGDIHNGDTVIFVE